MEVKLQKLMLKFFKCDSKKVQSESIQLDVIRANDHILRSGTFLSLLQKLF